MMTRMRIFWSIYCILLGILLLVKLLFRLDFNGWRFCCCKAGCS